MKPRAITGLGVASAFGVGRDVFFKGMIAPALPVETLDARRYPEAACVEVPNFDAARYLGEKGLRTLDRLTKLLVVAARLTMHDAGFKKDGVYVASSPERVGLCCSNAYGSLEAITELDRVAVLEDARYINPAKFPNTVSNSASGYASIWEDLRALNISVSDGNCGALDAVACADIHLEAGRADAILVGGAEALSEALVLAFHKLGALKTGTRLGEGAALVALELAEHAEARGAHVRGEIIGYGTSFVPPKNETELIFASEEAMQRACVSAIADAGIDGADVDVVCSGLSGLRTFDERELAAIAHVVPRAAVAAPKAILGETLGAAGAMGIAAALAWFDGARPSPIVRGGAALERRHKDGAPANTRTVLVTSMGFYGNASAVVMRRPANPRSVQE